MGLLPLNYRRPAYVDNEDFRRIISGEFDEKTAASLKSGRSGAASGIPDALAFDKIINGGTCPVSLRVRTSFRALGADGPKSHAPSEIS